MTPTTHPAWLPTFAAAFAREVSRADHDVACARARRIADAAVEALRRSGVDLEKTTEERTEA